jgi:AraC-like DNA-binding protein
VMRLEDLRRLLDSNYQRQFTLPELAERASLNRNYLCRAFRRYTGKTLFDYLANRRLQAAMLALRDSDDKVSAVAFESGFRDLSFFNRKFREAVGVTPSQYRSQLRHFRATALRSCCRVCTPTASCRSSP